MKTKYIWRLDQSYNHCAVHNPLSCAGVGILQRVSGILTTSRCNQSTPFSKEWEYIYIYLTMGTYHLILYSCLACMVCKRKSSMLFTAGVACMVCLGASVCWHHLEWRRLNCANIRCLSFCFLFTRLTCLENMGIRIRNHNIHFFNEFRCFVLEERKWAQGWFLSKSPN